MGELAGASAFTSLIIFVVEVFPSSRQAWSLDSLDSCRSPVFTVPTKDVDISKHFTSEPDPALVALAELFWGEAVLCACPPSNGAFWLRKADIKQENVSASAAITRTNTAFAFCCLRMRWPSDTREYRVPSPADET
jgi:hypothetical protein